MQQPVSMFNRRYFILFLLLLSSVYCSGTHIIGGSIGYEHVSGNVYNIKLIVYRDCYGGVPPFDQPAIIGMFDNNDSLIGTLSLTTADSIDILPQTICVPGNVCIKKATYTTSISVPLLGGPVTFSYQRCCRSNTILNIDTPGDVGMTFSCTIDPAVPNNSPEFNHEMPAFTYINDNLQFDGSAVDTDGDSLVYSFINVTDGGSQMNPVPNPPSNPPYFFIPFQSPYSLFDPIGGPGPLSIDPVSGLISGVPGTIGTFVLAEKVNEYRNGILINTHKKEFVIVVNPGNYYDVTGTAYTENGSQLLDIGKSWLIRVNLLDGILTAIDTNAVSGGNYSFLQAINSRYKIKASADSTSIWWANNLPTYYGDALFWYDGTDIDLCIAPVSNIDINLIQGINPGGPGFIGGLISQGANRFSSNASAAVTSMEGITVILFNQMNEPVAYGVTDAQGAFSIGNLPIGTYNVYIDRLNYYIDNSIAPQVTLNAANTSASNLFFLIHDTYLELAGFVGLNDTGTDSKMLTVHPNPANTLLYLQSDKLIFNGLGYIIYGVEGNAVQKGVINNNSIDVSNLSSQFYILEVSNLSEKFFSRFIKQ